MCDPGPYAKEYVSSNDMMLEIMPVIVNFVTFILFTRRQRKSYTHRSLSVHCLEELVCVCDVRGHKGHGEDV